ncbi:hypothetical protein ACHHYP_14415 [Achlya hypogyna]|uniref:Uncharacterized protein n=1 Tax=Achlya hypogyna TaxID=1202772 RepID=A0A1V9YD90_ACHHY|nr:hypothetical protein ACHHYP_14415 [Achlya hypogyna]
MSFSVRLRNLRTRIVYSANKLQYDTQKTAERIWYGSKNVGNATVQVPFMITTAMKGDLAKAGFPPQAIAGLTPESAHAILSSKTSFEAYQSQVEAAAAKVQQPSTMPPSAAIALVPEVPSEDPTSTPATSSAVAIVPDVPTRQ